ncbi:3-keto-5-aminohexanoate cleavage protein [PVC group bacterium]|nr:3-keto-5-aminohexanoate cleavage protein [PVC group bacterium]
MDNKFILNFTPTGMIPTKEMTPHVPTQPDEVVSQVFEVAAVGVNMVHLHARDPQSDEPTYKKDIYAKMIGKIREKHPDLVICVSTSGRTFSEFEKRSECLDLTGDLKPDFGSLTLSSLNFNKIASINTPAMIQDLAQKMLDNGIKPELEVFDLGMINYAHYLIKKQLIKEPYYFNLILGNIACAQANLLSLGLMVKELPGESVWAVGGIGQDQIKMNAMGIIAGGGVRIGLEDNIYFDNERTRLATNIELVQRILVVAQAMGRTPYSQKEARTILGC